MSVEWRVLGLSKDRNPFLWKRSRPEYIGRLLNSRLDPCVGYVVHVVCIQSHMIGRGELYQKFGVASEVLVKSGCSQECWDR